MLEFLVWGDAKADDAGNLLYKGGWLVIKDPELYISLVIMGHPYLDIDWVRQNMTGYTFSILNDKYILTFMGKDVDGEDYWAMMSS